MSVSYVRLVGGILGLCVALVGIVVAWVGLSPIAEGWGVHSLLNGNGVALWFAAGLAGVGFAVGGLAVVRGRGQALALAVGVLVYVAVVVLLPMEPKSADGLVGFGYVALVLVVAAILTLPNAD